ncbi:PucR family transcriptional regulator [Guptibacillus algicola]|uniref:PucR family transcriptional regulator n=1 Tax=Guptibacillus algicola TaxID=225844 RepID=UPI001CD7A11B|nr:PucR family transcriptional regulator [Alkalihalobacillus algicola]MCA0988308.1 PucR family transcriptional regulator ligand-binding domain-containing protein [Alkalihalobacillus algicola]
MLRMTSLTVQEVLEREQFRNATVVAGHKGLNRRIKWVHVMEVTTVKQLLNGDELILSTGFVWKDNLDVFMSIVKQFIQSNAAGLCIEIGTYMDTIPEEIIQLANEHQFPIIIFKKEVRFVNITQDLHSLLIAHHYQLISDLEQFSQELNNLLLKPDCLQNILTHLSKKTGMQVIYQPKESAAQFVPEVSNEKKKTFLHFLTLQPAGKGLVLQNVQAMDYLFAKLILVPTPHTSVSDYDMLLLDRSATAIAQFLLRELYIEEKKRVQETEWLYDWLDGKHSEERILSYLVDLDASLIPKGLQVCTCRFVKHQENYSSSQITYFMLLVRSLFEQEGFFVLSLTTRNKLVIILLNRRDESDVLARLREAFDRLMASDILKNGTVPEIDRISIGKHVRLLKEMHKSYESSLEALTINDKLCNQHSKVVYHHDFHIYRMIFQLTKSKELPEFMFDYLSPVIEYDETNNSSLLQTLKVYMCCNGSKKETAEQLFVVRQTLYHRLEKLEELLGKDFMSSPKRQAIEFSLYAYEYLQN